MKIPTLEEFRASRQSMFWHKAAKLLQIDEAYTDAPRALVYMNSVYIEDYIVENGYDDGHNKGQYVLVIDRNIYYLNNLSILEDLLYKYMMEYEDGF